MTGALPRGSWRDPPLRKCPPLTANTTHVTQSHPLVRVNLHLRQVSEPFHLPLRFADLAYRPNLWLTGAMAGGPELCKVATGMRGDTGWSDGRPAVSSSPV